MNKLRYADDTTLMAKSEEELKNLLMKVKEESETTSLKHNIQLDVLLSQFGTSQLFHVWFYLLFLDKHTGFSGDK